MFSKTDTFYPHLLHILDIVKGSNSFIIIPFLLINIFITKLLERTSILCSQYNVLGFFHVVKKNKK